MKLIIQIPCYNETENLPMTLAALPKTVPGFDTVEWLVIDDGSSDATCETARRHGVHHVVRLQGHQGLARAFMAGILSAVAAGADVIVNTDADNQYEAADIPALVGPILNGQADLVIGNRPIQQIQHFSPSKRFLQNFGSRMVRSFSGTNVQDAPSGFRAITRDAAMRLNVFNQYSYTLETIIQAGQYNLRIVNVPIRVNGPTRPSRLMRSMPEYLRRSMLVILNAFLIYNPLRVFSYLTIGFFIPAAILIGRYSYFAFHGGGRGHIQSVIAAAVFILCGVFMFAIGILAHLLAINRRLLEDIRYLELSKSGER